MKTLKDSKCRKKICFRTLRSKPADVLFVTILFLKSGLSNSSELGLEKSFGDSSIQKTSSNVNVPIVVNGERTSGAGRALDGEDLMTGLKSVLDRLEGLILVEDSESDSRVNRIVQDEVRPLFDRYLPGEKDYVFDATAGDGSGEGYYKVKFKFDESQMQLALDVLARLADLDESFTAADYALILRDCQPELFVSLFLKMPFEQRMTLEMQMDIAQDSDH